MTSCHRRRRRPERGPSKGHGRSSVQSLLDSDSRDLRTNLSGFDEGAVNVFRTHFTPDSAFSPIAIPMRGETTIQSRA